MNSDWDGPLGEHSAEDHGIIPQAIRNLHNPVAMRSYDLSGMGPGSDTFFSDIETENVYANGVDNASHQHQHNENTTAEQAVVPTVVRNLSLSEFRKRLIMHFDIAYQRREVKWPSARSRSSSTSAF